METLSPFPPLPPNTFLIGASCFARLRWCTVVRIDGAPPVRFIHHRLNGRTTATAGPPGCYQGTDGHCQPRHSTDQLLRVLSDSPSLTAVDARLSRLKLSAPNFSVRLRPLCTHKPSVVTAGSTRWILMKKSCYSCAFTPTNMTCIWLKNFRSLIWDLGITSLTKDLCV